MSQKITERVKRTIIEKLQLQIAPADIDDNAQLFAPSSVGGLDLDSLAALEIVVGLGVEFNLVIDEVPEEAFRSVNALAVHIAGRLDHK